MNDSLEYYNLHAKEFFDNTRDVEFTEMQDRFLKYLNPGARILDFGCGSGRDTKYFLGRGFKAEAVDGSEELVKIAAEYTGANVRQMFFQDLNENETYDGIWACSSILHLTYSELAEVFVKMARALVPHGILYTSFKYGTDEIGEPVPESVIVHTIEEAVAFACENGYPVVVRPAFTLGGTTTG